MGHSYRNTGQNNWNTRRGHSNPSEVERMRGPIISDFDKPRSKNPFIYSALAIFALVWFIF